MSEGTLAGRTALITGASSGLGADFARQLARRGCHVVLVARREERLRALRDEIQNGTGVMATVLPADLADPAAPAALHAQLAARNVAVDVLVNNAGFGTFGPELDIPWEKTREMLMVDIVALTQLTKLFARDMVARRLGYLLQVASIGAYQPSPTYAAYSAAKSYVRSYSQALNYELRGSGVSSTVISPGITATEFLQVSGQKRTWFHEATMMSSARVAATGIDAMLARRYSVVPGLFNKLAALMTMVTPDRVNAAITYQAMKNA